MAETKDKAAEAGKDPANPKTSLNSSVTSDLPNTGGPDPAATATVDLTKVQLPADAITMPAAPEEASALTKEEREQIKIAANSFESRVIDASIGQVQVEGIDFRYIGVAPARMLANGKEIKTPGGYPISPENTRFTPLGNVPFSPSIRIQDPKTGEYYYPADGVTSWGEVASAEGTPLIPKEADKKTIKAREEAIIEARKR